MARTIALLAAAPAAVLLTAWLGCAPKQPVPNGPNHPADPAAAEAPAAPDPAPPADEHAAGGGHGDDHGAAGDATDDHAGHEHGGAGADDVDPLIAAEMTAYQAAKPIFEQHCASCHTSSGTPSKAKKKALGHFTMDSYPFGGHHAGELGTTIRKVLGAGGGKPTMPKDDPGAVEGRELELVVAWTRAYDDAARAGVGYHGDAKEDDHGDGDGHGGHDHHGD
jgi:mono/diheme cytochrome c family protein